MKKRAVLELNVAIFFCLAPSGKGSNELEDGMFGGSLVSSGRVGRIR